MERHQGRGLWLVLVVCACRLASGSVYDDVTAWWHLDYADSGTAAAGEVRDARTWYSGGAYAATSVQGTPEWTTAVPSSGRGPAGGQVYGGRGLDFTPAVDGGGNVAPDGFYVSNLALGGDATLVTRFKWDGYPSDQSSAWMYNNAYGNDQGWLLGLTSGDASPQLLRYRSTGGSVSPDPGWTTTPGVWYDLAVVVDENGSSDTVTYYRWEEGGNLQSASFAVDANFDSVGSGGTRVGFESTSGTNGRKAFDGVMEHLAVWNRALDANEVAHAFGSPNPIGAIGIDTNNSENFNMESAAGNTYIAGEPWGKLSRALTEYGNSQIDIYVGVTAEQAALPYIFHLDTNGGSAPTFPIAVLVNGVSLGTQDVPSNGDAEWIVRNGLVAGANTISLRYAGSGGGNYITWDWMELTGAWQVGTDNNSAGEFEGEWLVGDNFYATDPNLKHLERAHTHGDPDINLHFDLSDELADHAFLYTTRVVQQGGGAEHPFDILVNGILAASYPTQPNNTQIDVPIRSDWLQAGDNVITVRYQGTSSHSQWDFHRLQPRNDSMETENYWMLGFDNDSTAEFASEGAAPDDFDIGDFNWQHFERAVTVSDLFTNIHFPLSAEQALHSFRLAFEVYSPENPDTGFEVYLNDVLLLADLGSHGELFSLDIPWQDWLMQPGDNVLTMRWDDQAGRSNWIQWDWIRLDMLDERVPEPCTLSLLALGGLALLRRRRRA